MEVQLREVGQVSEFLRYRPSEIVVPEVQQPEVGQVSEFGRQCAVQRRSTNVGDRYDALRGSS